MIFKRSDLSDLHDSILNWQTKVYESLKDYGSFNYPNWETERSIIEQIKFLGPL